MLAGDAIEGAETICITVVALARPVWPNRSALHNEQ